ncbi:MAG: rhodanese-like domain-containing protein [Magnetovibrionaceae bacterium]
MADGYAGDLTPKQAWEKLQNEDKAVLVDVRTQAEWNFVGVPELGPGREPLFVQWQKFPSGLVNTEFVDQVREKVPAPDTPILFLCRSGGRSAAAATALTEAGYGSCYNVLSGFEGDKDGDGHRGTTGGWKVEGLPWKQG